MLPPRRTSGPADAARHPGSVRSRPREAGRDHRVAAAAGTKPSLLTPLRDTDAWPAGPEQHQPNLQRLQALTLT